MEFIDVIKKFKRMEHEVCVKGKECKGNECPLAYDCTNCYGEEIGQDILDNPKLFEEKVIKWDKENPEVTNYAKLVEIVKKTFDTVGEEIFVGENNIVFTKDFAKKKYVEKRL